MFKMGCSNPMQADSNGENLKTKTAAPPTARMSKIHDIRKEVNVREEEEKDEEKTLPRLLLTFHLIKDSANSRGGGCCGGVCLFSPSIAAKQGRKTAEQEEDEGGEIIWEVEEEKM